MKRKEAGGSEKCYIRVENEGFSENQVIEILSSGGLMFGYVDCLLFWKYEFGALEEETEI